ncbi:MAG TPA: hypothetical protein VF173_29760 [Thermoanaerobaculia bacterium]|nr:hypothetical protein [Thermoanaerobaculia bacterium]
MAFTFRIIFSGISAFVPDQPFHGKESPSQMTVLFPSVLVPRLPAKTFCDHDELERRIVAPHYPMIQFEMKNLRTSKGLQSLFVREQSTGANSIERRGVGCLLNQDITVLPDGRPLSEGKLTLIDGQPVDPDNPTPDEEQYLFWLKNIGDVVGKPSKVGPRFLGPLSKDGDIATRIRFSTGRLRTAGLSDVKFELLPFGGDAKIGLGAKLATRVALELEADEKVTLTFRDFESKDGVTKLVFVPSDADPDEDVEIRLENLEPENLLGVPQQTGGEAAVLIDPDFAVYYEFVDGLGTDSQILVPHHAIEKEIDGGGLGKPCSPVGIDGTGGG